jgi:hypothetical protein
VGLFCVCGLPLLASVDQSEPPVILVGAATMRVIQAACVAAAILNLAFWFTYGLLSLLSGVATVLESVHS